MTKEREAKLINHVKGHSTFDFYRDGLLWFTTDTGMMFSVPVDELGAGTVYTLNKSITLMHWISKQMDLDAAAMQARRDHPGDVHLVPRSPIPDGMIDGDPS